MPYLLELVFFISFGINYAKCHMMFGASYSETRYCERLVSTFS